MGSYLLESAQISYDLINVEKLIFASYYILADINLPNGVDVLVKDHDCGDLIERLYYACGYHPICIYCGEYVEENNEEENDCFPQCVDCDGPAIFKRK